MNGIFYDLDDWMKLVEKQKRETTSEGAQWWLSRIRDKSRALS